MKTRTGFSVAVLAAAILLLLPIAPVALAQDQGQYPDQNQGNYQDPPTRAGRIGFVQGSVSFQPGGQGDWLDAVPNRPLTSGDNLWVDRDSRAEVQIGSTSIRLGPETSLTFLELGDDVTQLRLSTGTLFFRVRHFGADDTFEVDAPNLAFNVNRAGEFRLDVNQNGDQTVATVWRGEGEITGGGDSYRLDAGQQGTFSGTDQLRYDVAGIGAPDDFGRWAVSRDEREDRVQSRDYVSDEMTGYEDLDDYGRWHDVAGYGNVWTPAGVPGDWAPYRYGSWTYVSPWGWTWVEQEPWGFAPFHYGRWASVEGNWCWIPGPVAVRPVYSPALVAFVGGGGGFHIGVGVGVGWFPLGPGEVFVPWYRTSPRYVQNVNITNTRVNVVQVTNVYNNVTINHVTNVTYVNQRVNNSVTVVNHDTFVNARPVHDNIVRVDQRQIQSAPVGREAVMNVQPARQSVLGAGRPVQMKPPEQVINRPVVATRQPVVVNRPAGAPGVERTSAAPPPVKMIRSAPATEAQPLQRGQSGSSAGVNAPGAGGPRPGAPNNPAGNNNNRGGSPQPGQASPQPGAQGNNPRQGEMAPRPGAPNNQPENNNNRGVSPRPGEPAPQPGVQGNNPRQGEMAPRPGAPNNQPENNNNRGGSPRSGDTAPQPGMQGNNPRQGEMAPRPGMPNNPQENNNNRGGSPRPGESAPQPGVQGNNPRQGEMAPRPGNPQPGAVAPPPQNGRGMATDNNRPSQEVPRPPSAVRPQEQMPPTRQENARPESTRPENAPPQNGRPPAQNVHPDNPRQDMQNSPSPRPEPTRPPETQRPPQEAPRPPQMREQPTPQAPPPARQTAPARPEPAPQPEIRSEPAPRPESRPAPPPQSQPAQAQPRNERPAPPPKEEKPPKEENQKDKPPQKFR